MFADSFCATGFRAAIESWLLALLLNGPSIEIVANHNLAASLDLKRIGVDPKKIVPYDWPAVIEPRAYAPKSAPPGNRVFRLIYVGSVIEAKGVGDAIQAVSRLRKRGKGVELTIIGQGDTDRFKQLAKVEDVESSVFFLGRRSHPEVLAAMRDHDAVLVPSHWGYPEGLPMTLYEAMCTRTPLVTSDHPMFKLRIRDRQNALIFPARNPSAFAERIDELASTPELYAKLSAMAEKTADDYLCPMKFDRLILDFLSPTKRRKLRDYSLANYAYFDDADV
jgi:glycosyltransferase involved in cell wall biosynthesis